MQWLAALLAVWLAASAQTATASVCNRTAEVRDAIVAAVTGKSACADIKTADLAGITTLAISNKSTLTTLKSDDFDDLTNLTSLTLSNTGVSSLPAGVFDELTKLTTLDLKGNSALACLPFIPASVTTLELDKARSAYAACGAGVTLRWASPA